MQIREKYRIHEESNLHHYKLAKETELVLSMS